MKKTTPTILEIKAFKNLLVILLFCFFLIPNNILGQCIPGVLNFPSDFEINDNDECTSIVTWVEPTYSINCDDFVESFDPSIWVLNANGQDGSVNTAGSPGTISVTGSTNGTAATNTDTDFCITIPFDGNINFDWTATAIGGGAQLINDEPAYTIDGAETILNVTGTPVGSGVSTESGSIADLAVTAGQVFCFRAKSNNQGATTTVDLSNFTFEITQIEQTSGVALDSEQSIGDYMIEYTVPNCDGTASSCEFTITVEESIAPMITCPIDITMDTDTDLCSAVVCFDVEVTDNCPAVLPDDIPGFNFLGTYDGHNYFSSAFLNILGWEDANAAAAAVGGHLAVITSEEEQDFIIDNVSNGLYWIGLRYSPSLDAFKWVNGEPFGYESWGFGQPGGLLEGDYVFNLDVGGSFFDGWYDSPSILPINYIVEIETYETELTAGLPPGSIFPVGITEVTYVASDASGNTDECSFNVIVVDNQAPVIDCPMDSVIQLAAEQCDTIVTFDDPLFTDNCPDAIITQIAGLPSGSPFPIGENIISFEARDTTGNVDTCTWSVIVNEYIPNGLLCNGEINFSIDEESCSGELLPSMLIDVTSVGCADSCTITVKGADGIKRPAVFSTDDIGKTFEYEICCGGICCWGIVNVEFKFDPVILCVENDTLSCTQAFDESTIRPDISMSCAPATLLLVDEEIENLNCDSLFTAKMVRKYTAVDIYGNTSDTCEQTIFLRRTNLDSISPVQPYAIFNNQAISCSSGFATTSQGYPYPALSVTGAPRLRVEGGEFIDLYPFESALICNGFAEFEDELMPGSTSCVTKIIRTFTIGEWWCGGTNDRTFKQLIEVVDFDGPEIICPDNMTVSTGSFECTASVSFPFPTGEDACNNELVYNIATPVGDIENYQGESFTLPAGEHTINYAVYDACGQGSFCSFTITVVDNADPIAICDQFTEVSLSLETTTYVPAESIDDGSFDECGPVTLSVARMDDPGFEDFTGFGPEIDITCDDAGQTIMVGLLVTDAGGNTNMCMVSVAVKDKIEAQMVCPADTTVECNFAYDPDNLSAFFGDVVIYDNCPAANTLDDVIVGSLNSCGSGVLTRQITLLNAQGVQTDYCEQTITFANGSPLEYGDIIPPNSPVEVTGCGIFALENADVRMPIIPDGVCQQVAMSVDNDTFPFTEEGACLKIIRTYKVIDWCITSGYGSAGDPFEFEQIIKVSNTEKPIFTNVFVDSTYCSFAGDCGGIVVTGLTAESSDDCTDESELINKYETRNAEGTVVRFGNGLDASGAYDLGDYTVTFIAEDKCGNQQATTSTFSVISCKQPVPYCLDGLSTSLTLMDPDEDGEFVAMVMLDTEFFDAGSYHPCDLDITISFSSDTTNKQIIFDCNGIGDQEVQLWVTDSNGNQDFCIASLDVQDNDGLCNGEMEPVDIQGRIYTVEDAELNEATVQLISAEMQEDMTDGSGEYGFMDMPQGGYYSIAPHKDDDVLNGVSTLDLVMIQRHILGISELDNAYAYLAADINHDDRLTATDLVTLRKTILGINTKFTNNTSWRFIDEQHVFEDETDPWSSPFAESYDIEGLTEDMWVDFIAVKVGDINGNVDANLQAGIISETRSAQSLIMALPNTNVEEGKVYEIEVLASDAINVRGLQIAFSLSGLEIVEIKNGSMNIKTKDFVTTDDALKMSYANAIGDYAQADDVLYTLVVRAKSDGLLSEMIEINDESLSAEAYIGSDLKVGSVEIEWRDEEVVLPLELLVAGSTSPNPWRSQTEINFEIPNAGLVGIIVRDASGRVIFTKESDFEAGNQSFTITNDDVSTTGLLLYELKFGEQIVHKKMIRIE
jgi:hypothetical protein